LLATGERLAKRSRREMEWVLGKAGQTRNGVGTQKARSEPRNRERNILRPKIINAEAYSGSEFDLISIQNWNQLINTIDSLQNFKIQGQTLSLP
jgi:hypothetical protein